MLSKIIPLALCAFAFVQAIPFSENLNVGYGVSNKSEVRFSGCIDKVSGLTHG
jgi:hypothetical protein